MLTKDQLKQLDKLTKDRKYGPLLKAAIGAALVGKFVETDDILMTVCSTFNIGAFRQNNDIDSGYRENIQHYFYLTEDEFNYLHYGFDNVLILSHNSEAYQFGLAVRKIVNLKEVE